MIHVVLRREWFERLAALIYASSSNRFGEGTHSLLELHSHSVNRISNIVKDSMLFHIFLECVH